jgi:hypothetical protein
MGQAHPRCHKEKFQPMTGVIARFREAQPTLKRDACWHGRADHASLVKVWSIAPTEYCESGV